MSDDLIDLSNGTVVSSFADKPGPKARQMLVEEIERRTGIKLSEDGMGDQVKPPVIYLGTRAKPGPARKVFRIKARPRHAEGYSIEADSEKGCVAVIGNDARGLLFGVGRLLRVLDYGEDYVSISSPVSITSHPRYPIRGHQLGYRTRSNTYDSWGLVEYEQYIRDLVAWGANSIELIAPVPSGDVIRDLEFASKAWDVSVRLSDLLDAYDLDVHLWMPVDDRVLPGSHVHGLKSLDFLCPSTRVGRKSILGLRRRLFEAMNRIDAVFIPGGDPGGCRCEKCRPWAMTLIPLAKEIGHLLAESHPKAKIWLSNQMFSNKENEYLFGYLEKHNPDWFGGLVYSPWTAETIERTRERLPDIYPIRNYPDICHSLRCQYPANDWDHAYALIEGREPPNPRPMDQAHIHYLYSKYSCGNLTYSDGVNDDVNKIIWAALDWDDSVKVRDVLVEYGRYFIDTGMGDSIADGILALERNWQGNLIENDSVDETLRTWQGMERDVKENARRNWRFQLCLFRAYLDAYVRRKLMAEKDLEREALQTLTTVKKRGTEEVLRSSIGILSRDVSDMELRQKVEELAEELNKSVSMKLGKRFGAEPERADILEFLDERLNNCEWMISEINSLLNIKDEEGRLRGINRVLNWEDPGPGSFYDDLGNPNKQPHLVRRHTWQEDPGRIHTSAQEFDHQVMKGGRLSWRRQEAGLWDTPVEMRYQGLDPDSEYLLRVTYGGYRHGARFKLNTSQGLEIHPSIDMPRKSRQFEFRVPRAATKSGELDLVWSLTEERRGLAVAEVWLLKAT